VIVVAAALPVIVLLGPIFFYFSPTGVTRFTNQGIIWQGRANRRMNTVQYGYGHISHFHFVKLKLSMRMAFPLEWGSFPFPYTLFQFPLYMTYKIFVPFPWECRGILIPIKILFTCNLYSVYMYFVCSETCPAGTVRCGPDAPRPCIREDWRCDGYNHCGDKSDEKDCGDLTIITITR